MATGIRPTTYVDLDGVMIGPTVSPFGAKAVEYTDLTPEQVVAYVARYGAHSLNKPEEALKIVAAAEKQTKKEAPKADA